jgi:hypothetical protein
VVTVPLSLRGICGRVHLLGLVIGVNLNAYDARHQWTRDAVDTGNALVDILTAGDGQKTRPWSGAIVASERLPTNGFS